MGHVPPELSAWPQWVLQRAALLLPVAQHVGATAVCKVSSFLLCLMPTLKQGGAEKGFCFPAEIASTSHGHSPCRCSCCVQVWDD